MLDEYLKFIVVNGPYHSGPVCAHCGWEAEFGHSNSCMYCEALAGFVGHAIAGEPGLLVIPLPPTRQYTKQEMN